MTRRKKMTLAVCFGIGVLWLGALAISVGHNGIFADDDDHEGHEALIKTLGTAKINLQQGLTASEQEGQPISGKFELDEGKFQLSVYAAKDGKFSEVLVDYASGKVAKVEPLTKGDDFTAAISQSAAMAKAKTSLQNATDKAIGETAGSRAVGVVPSLKDGHPIATVLLLTGEQFKTVEKSLE